MKFQRFILSLSLLLAGMAGNVAAQDFSFSAGRSKTLYDGRYYPDIFGEGVAPKFNTFDFRVGWTDYSSSPFASICNHPEMGVGFQLDGALHNPSFHEAERVFRLVHAGYKGE